MRYVTHNGQAVLQPELASDANATTSQRHYLTTIRDYSTGVQPCSSRGASGGDPEGGARRGVLRLRLVTACLGRSGTPPARHYDLAARSSLHGSGGNAGEGSAGPGRKSPRWSAERRASFR